ncbi:MAG TPA: single-stranded-DNA-specific exonuclease RecJ [Candidatus Gracilibacteria bacterium]|nr:single-stranded-DNA-specific exonuclease RecJ [Candidatus Gracilibacteria bacterium]
MSVLGKLWKIRNEDSATNAIDKILSNRGLTKPEQVEAFLNSSFKKGVHNPFLMKDMEKALQRLKKAIKNGEKIMIFGDYDVDGISGTAILVHALKLLGARVSYRLPHRVEDGYGLSNKFIEDFKKIGVELLITVDCGISCKEQIDLAAKKKIDVIITDHHTIPEQIPDKAYAILHTLQPGCEYPFKGLTGAGVAYKLACALIADLATSKDRDLYISSLLDLASLGTVADLGPLVDENRIIVKYGLQSLQNTRWEGLNHLKAFAGIEPGAKLDINDIGFRISPRINAAGRIANPYYALQLLLYDKGDERGKILAEHLDKLNQKRQQMVAEALIELDELFTEERAAKKILIAWHENWHAGILGLLAAKCVEKYNAPSIIMQDFGDYLVASGRSPEWFNMVEALRVHGDLLKSFGGHIQAAGFTVEKEKLPQFVEAMEAYAFDLLQHNTWHPTIEVDCELTDKEIDDRLLDFLNQLEPFGVGNEQPLFLLKNLTIANMGRVGKDQSHLRFEVYTENRKFPVIAFKLGEHEEALRSHQKIDLVCYLERNEWKGMTKTQLRAIDASASRTE